MKNNLETSQYELLKIILDFVGSIIWPITIFIIVLIYRKSIHNLLIKARKVELPGGLSLETFEENIQQAKNLAEEIATERKPETKDIITKSTLVEKNELNKKMINLGLTPSPSGLNLDYYKNIAKYDPRLALIGLRSDLELMLKNLAKGFKIFHEEKESINRIISKLYKENAISIKQYEFINTVFKIANSAVHGIVVSQDQVYEVLEIAQVLVDDYIAWLDWGFSK